MLRENQEEAKKRELGNLNSHYQQTKLILEKNLLEQIEVNQKLKEKAKTKVNVAEIQSYHYYWKVLKDKEKNIHKNLEIINDQIYLKKEELKQAMKERKIIENLKEIAYENYLEEQKQQESKIVDEIVSYKYTTKGKEEENA